MTTNPYEQSGASTFDPEHETSDTSGYGASHPDPAADYVTAPSHGSSGGGSPTTDKAADEAGQVKDTAVDAAQQVAGTARDEAGNVAGEAKAQASNLLDQVKGEAGSQAETQQQRLAGVVSSYAKELGSMASGSDESGPLTDLTQQASQKVAEAAQWLENRKPAELLDEARSFARRRPGAFLLGAAVAGVVVGRLTRGAVAEAKSEGSAPGADQELSAEARSSVSTPAEYSYTPKTAGYDDTSAAGLSDRAAGPGAGHLDPLTDRPLPDRPQIDQAPGDVIR